MVNSYYFKNFNTIQSVGHPAKYRTIELCNFQRKPTLLFFFLLSNHVCKVQEVIVKIHEIILLLLLLLAILQSRDSFFSQTGTQYVSG